MFLFPCVALDLLYSVEYSLKRELRSFKGTGKAAKMALKIYKVRVDVFVTNIGQNFSYSLFWQAIKYFDQSKSL